MMKKAITLTKVLIIIFSVFILLATPVMALFLMPHAFYGSVLVDGSPAPDGLTVTAAIAGATFPHPVTTTTVNGNYGYDWQFQVPADNDETTAIKEGGVNGDVIIFYVDGLVAGSYSFEIGQVTRLNLSITRPTPPTPPAQPSNLLPANGATGISLTPTLFSSSFSDPDTGDTHLASQWHVTTTPSDFGSRVFDSGWDTTNRTIITIPSGILNYSTTYYWRVSHQDNHSAWSDPSLWTSFTTIAQTTPPPPPPPTTGRRSLPDPSTFIMVGSGLGAGLLYIGLSRLRRRLSRS